MQLSRLLYNYKPSKAIKAIIFLPILLVSVGVTSGCFEEDCLANKSIKLVNPSTGECIACFPCLDCEVGTPSVPCGVTVPQGTDIQCVPLHPSPSVVSKTSATSGTLTPLAGSSVTMQPSSLLKGNLMMTSAPTASTTHSAVVATTSFSHPTPLVVYTGSITTQTRKKREFPPDEIQKKSSHTTVYFFFIFLPVILIAIIIVCRMQKRKKAEELHLPITNVVTNQEPENSVMPSDQGGDRCTVHPSTITAAYSRSHSKEDQESRMDNDNQHFQPDEADIVSYETATIPSSVDVTNTEGDQVAKFENQDSKSGVDVLVDLSPTSPHPATEAPKVPQTFNSGTSIVTSNVNILFQHAIFQSPNQLVPQCLDVWNGNNGEVDQRGDVNWAALSQEDKYHTKILEVPIPLLHKICLTLDVKRVDGKDAGLLAHKLGLSVSDFRLSQQAAQNKSTSTTYILLSENFHGTVAEFVQIMKDIERDDVISLIDGWNG